jgi:6-pyruvoyltetrahydropterin/6-carboxytetrahydropterin synthase
MRKWPKARIGRIYTFDAAHWLPGVPEGHKCRNMHGHTYTVELTAFGEVSPQTGMVVDFAMLDESMRPILARLDHGVLNDVIENPTAENIARFILAEFPQKFIERVRVRETPRSWAEVWADWARVVKNGV